MPTKNKKLQDVQKLLKNIKIFNIWYLLIFKYLNSIKICTLSQISDTRWICHHKNCKAVINNFKNVLFNNVIKIKQLKIMTGMFQEGCFKYRILELEITYKSNK